MPVTIIAGPRPEDTAIGARIEASGSNTVREPLMLLRRLEVFMAERRIDQNTITDPATAWKVVRDFVIHMLSADYADPTTNLRRDGVRAVTGLSYYRTMRTYGIRPGNLAVAEATIHSALFLKGLERLAALDKPARSRVYPTPRAMLGLLTKPKAGADYEREISMQAFWYLLILTGNRPANLQLSPPSWCCSRTIK